VGRLPALTAERTFPTRCAAALVVACVGLVGLVGLVGCNEDAAPLAPPPSAGGRSNAVVVSGDAGKAAAVAVSASAPSPEPRPARALCTQPVQGAAPKGAIKVVTAPGATPVAASVPFGVGKWIWLNFWAAWCAPCKEEMPRLLGWQRKLTAAGKKLELAFVSIDDDDRQLARFLEAQPPDGVRSTYWLPDGGLRGSWLAPLGLKETPELPAHALVAPSGQIACVIQGAVEDSDYPAIAAFIEGHR
jgi:thiol-disulfide isomerase/thioredoxin